MKLNVNNLNVNINKAHILKNFSLEVEDGELVHPAAAKVHS